MSNSPNPPRKRGCLFYGCLSLLVVTLVVIVTAFLAFHLTKRWANRTINQYTDTTPATFEQVDYTPVELQALQQRLAAFNQSIANGAGGQELVLTAHDLNVLVSENADLKGHLFVVIEDDRVKGLISVPLDKVLPPEIRDRIKALQGRHLNGSATFRVVLEGGVLDVRLEALEAKGKSLDKIPLFARTFADLKKRNLALEFEASSQSNSNAIRRWESLVVKDGRITLRSKAATP